MLKFLKRQSKPIEVRLPEQAHDGKIEVGSSTWMFISNWAATQLQVSREKNDYAKLDEKATMLLRGRIKVLKEFLELPMVGK